MPGRRIKQGLRALYHRNILNERQLWHSDSTECDYSLFFALENYSTIYVADKYNLETNYIEGKTRILIPPGSVLILRGNTPHAGDRYMGDGTLHKYDQSTMEYLFPYYARKPGNLKLFYSVHNKAMFGREQRWFFEEGNKYGKDAGISNTPVVGKHVNPTLSNDSDAILEKNIWEGTCIFPM